LNSTTRLASLLVSGGILLFADASPSAGQRTGSSRAVDRSETSESIAVSGLPVDFVENRGQWGGPAAFVARQGRMAASLEPGAVKILLAADRRAEVSLTGQIQLEPSQQHPQFPHSFGPPLAMQY